MAYDLITVGRANMDLYSVDVGQPFEKVRNFEAMVGGSPTNIAIAGSRLGLETAVFTAVGYDVVGDFVVDYLVDEGVATEHLHRIEGKLTSLALLGVQPPSLFPLLFYRDDPADIHLTSQQAELLPLATSRAIQLSGNAFSRGSTAEVAWQLVADSATHVEATFVDLDLRPTDWAAPAEFGDAMQRLIPLADVVIGTEEEFAGVVLDRGRALGSPASGAERALINERVAQLAAEAATALIVKRGHAGATAFVGDLQHDVAGFDVPVVNTVGAGDAFASGVIRSRLRGHDWPASLVVGNACGAIQVTRHGCSSAFPTEPEVADFISAAKERSDG